MELEFAEELGEKRVPPLRLRNVGIARVGPDDDGLVAHDAVDGQPHGVGTGNRLGAAAGALILFEGPGPLRRPVVVQVPRHAIHPGVLADVLRIETTHGLSVRIDNRDGRRLGGAREIVGNDCAVESIRAGVFVRRNPRIGERVHRRPLPHPVRVANREERNGRRLRARPLLQRGQVVEDPDAASVRADHQVVRSRLDRQIVDCRRRHVQPQRLPVRAAVERDPYAAVRSSVEDVAVARILTDRPDELIRRQIAGDGVPGRAVVVGSQHVRMFVAEQVALDRNESGTRREAARIDPHDSSPRRHDALGRRYVLPVRSLC